jgi:hypothetical protein
MLDKVASVQEDPLFPDLQKAVALLAIPLDNLGGQKRIRWGRHGLVYISPLKARIIMRKRLKAEG